MPKKSMTELIELAREAEPEERWPLAIAMLIQLNEAHTAHVEATKTRIEGHAQNHDLLTEKVQNLETTTGEGHEGLSVRLGRLEKRLDAAGK